MEERDGHDIFGPYTPNNLTLTMDGFMQEDQLGNPTNLGEQNEEHHQPKQPYQNQASIPCWSPLKGKNREIIDSMSNSMAMPSTSSSTNIGVSAYLNPLLSMRTPMSVGIETEEEEEGGTELTDSSSSTETESESEEEKAASNDSDYEPTNEEEEEAVVEKQKIHRNINRQQKNTLEKIRPKFDKEKGSNVELKSNKYKIGDDGIVRSKYANRKSQKGIPKDCGWERVDEQANNSNSGNDVQQQQVAGDRAVFRRTRGRWQSNQWKFVTEMRITENLEAEIKQKYGVYAYVRAKPTNMRCKRVLFGCTYKMLLRRNCEDIPDGFVHLYERNAHNHEHIEAPEGFMEAPIAKWSRYKHKRYDDWLFIGRRWTLEQIMAHKKAHGLRGHFIVQKRDKRQYFTLQYLQCGFTSADGQRCEYRIRSKQNYDVIDDDEPTFTVSERGKHNHENTLEDVEVEDDDDEVEMNDGVMTDEQIQQQQQSTSSAAILENNLKMQFEQNYGLEEEEEDDQDLDDLEQFELATEPISAGYPPIVEVDLLMLVSKIAQSAHALNSALASKRKRNKNGAEQEERRKNMNDDAPLWEGEMMMRNLEKRIAGNKAKIRINEEANQQQQPSTSFAAAAFDVDSSQSTSIIVKQNTIESTFADLHLKKHNLEQQNSNSNQTIKPIPKKTIVDTDATITNEPLKIKWRYVGQCSYTDFYKKVSDEPWMLYGKNGFVYYYKCAREPMDHEIPCNFRIRLHSHMKCNNHFVIYESGQHNCGLPAEENSFAISNGLKENKNTISYRRNRVKLQHYRLGKMEKWTNKMKKVTWCPLPGEWTRERMYQRARDEHGLRLYAWRGIARLYFECGQIGIDGIQCDFKLRAMQIEKGAAEKSNDAVTTEIDDLMGESDNIGQVELRMATDEDSTQFLYKLSESTVWHNHNTTVLPIGRAQYKLKNVDLSKWKFVKDVYNFYQYRDLRFQLGVPDSRQHFRSFKQATLNCVQKATRGPIKQQCPYCILLFRDFQHGPVHVYEKGEHKHSITDEDDGHDYDKNKLRKCGFMDSQPWMLIAENVTKEELIQYAEKHELDPMQKGLRLIYFKCNKFGPDDRICQFKICGRIIKKKQQLGGNNGGTQMEDDFILAENPDEAAEELNDKNAEDAEEGNQLVLYKLFETKYYHNHACMAPISEKRYVGMNKNDVFDDANGQWNLKTTVYDWEGFQDLKRTENLPRYNFFNHQRILLICSCRGCKYKLQIYRRFIGDPMKVYVQNEKHNHPPNKTIMAVRYENDERINDTGKIYRKNGTRCLKKSRKIAKLRPIIIKSNKKNSTIFEQIINSNLDGQQMSLEQFCQAYWSIELEQQQNKELQESGEKNLQIEQNTRKSIQNQIEEMEEEQQENLEQYLEQLEEGTSQRLFVNEKEMVTVQRVEFQREEFQREDSNEIREEMPEDGSIEDQGIMLLSSPMPITSSAPENYPISADQQNRAIASELLIPILGQGPSAFKKPVTRYRRSTSLINEAFTQFGNNGDICQGPTLSNSAPPQFSTLSNLEVPIIVNQSQMFPINSSTTFSEMPKINRTENVLNCQELPRYSSPRMLNCQELPRYSSPRILNCQELSRYSSPRILNCQELPRYSSPRILNCQELSRYSSPRILNCQELPRYSSPRILNCQELPRYSSPRILNCQEMPSFSLQIQGSVEQQYSFPSSSSAIPSAESQQINNEFDVDANTNTQENYTEFLDFDESNQAAELSSNSIPKDQNEENTINFEINDGNNNCQKEGQNDNVFSRLAPPLSSTNDFLQINDNDNEDENQIAVSQTMTSLLGAVDEATNATNELNETEQCENGEQTISSNLFSPNHAEKWTKLSTDEKSRMDTLYQKYLQKWRTNQHMKKVINRPKANMTNQRSGKITSMKKRKKRRPRGLFVKTRAAKRRMEEEKQRRSEFVRTRRGAYLDDSSDEDGNNGNEKNDNRIENVGGQELDNADADAECNQNEDGNIGGEFEEEIGIGFLEDTNEEETNIPSISQKAISISIKRKRGRPSIGSSKKPSTSPKIAKRGRPLRSTKKAAERQKTPKPQKEWPKKTAAKNLRNNHQKEANNGSNNDNEAIKEEEFTDLRHYLENGGFDKEANPSNPYHIAVASPAHSSISSTDTIPAEIDEDQLINSQMPTPFQLPSPITPPATSSRINIPNQTVQPYYMQFPPIVAQMNAISQQATEFRPDCLEDVGAEAVIGDEVEEIMATGELTEIKVEEEQEGDRRNYKNGMERRNNCQLVPMTTIKTNCRHRPIAELHASSSKEIVRNSTQSAIEDLSQIQSTSNAPPIIEIELKSNLDSIGEVLMETSIPFTGDEADDRHQLETVPRMMTQSTPKKKQQKRRRSGQSNASPNAKRAKPNESNTNKLGGTIAKGPNSKSNSTPAGKNRGRGRPPGSTKKQQNITEKTPTVMSMPGNNNQRNDTPPPPEPSFNLSDFAYEQLELLGAEWGLHLQKRGSHLLFFKPVPVATEEEFGTGNRKSRILRHTTMGLLLMDNGDHVQVDECELIASDGSYRPNAKPTDRWFKGKASGRKFLRCLHRKMERRIKYFYPEKANFMKILLPLEVWVDVFASISRHQLALRLEGIGSQSFAAIVMLWLHEYGKVKLGQLNFGGNNSYHKMAETEMPANIIDFESIEICAQDDEIDCSLMTIFFTNLRPLLSNVNLWCNFDHFGFDFYENSYQVPDFLDKLLPLIKSINSIHFYDYQCLDLIYEKFVDKFFSTKMVSYYYFQVEKCGKPNEDGEHLDEEYEEDRRMAILRKWLLFDGNTADHNEIIDNDDANVGDQPRILKVDNIPSKICDIQINRISKQFMQSTKPTHFIVCFTMGCIDAEKRHEFEAIRHVNQTTNELLSVKCFVIEEDDDEFSSAIFLHSHPIVLDGKEHEGNMLLINKMVETMYNGIEDKLVFYNTNRHINVYRKGCKFLNVC